MIIAIVGADTLMGRELRELAEQRLPDAEVKVLAGEDAVISAGEDEPYVIEAISPDSLEDVNVVLLAGTVDAARSARSHASSGTLIIDVSGSLEDEPDARLVDAESPVHDASGIRVIAHPAALALSMLLRAAHESAPLRHAVVQVFEPASERGQAGLNELQQQTTSLLSFRQLDKKVFDAQLGFTMLPRYGEDAPQSLEATEQRIERHLASLLAGEARLPSLRLIQAPVFHGHSYSLWLEFEERPDLRELVDSLSSAGIEVREADVEPPTNVGMAGQSGVAVGLVEADRNAPHAVWMWAASDNLRIAADTALALAGARR